MEDEIKQRARKSAERYIDACGEYSDAFEHEKLVRDWMKTRSVAEKVVQDFRRRAGEVNGKRLLDLGFGNGMYACAFAHAGAQVSGLEVNPVLLDIAKENMQEEGVTADLRTYNGNTFPFEDTSFDYAFSVSVLEHVSDAGLFLRETDRVLKPGGTYFLAFPNRWRPQEAHTHILFLSYLPRTWVQFLLRTLLKRNTVEELNLHFVSYWSMKRLLRGTSLQVVPEFEGRGLKGAIKRILWSLGIHHSAILGTVMIILKKNI